LKETLPRLYEWFWTGESVTELLEDEEEEEEDEDVVEGLNELEFSGVIAMVLELW
jgi:hypothetical protein